MTTDFESILRDLFPVRPSGALDRRIEALLRGHQARPSVLARLRPWVAAGASLAAAALLALTLHTPLQWTTRPALVDARQWSSFENQGLVHLDAATTGYAISQTTLHQWTFADPHSGAHMSWAWPEHQWWFVPVDYQ